ncbi:hypothetical protein EON65_49670 [archaeon]|nr:MAG: hypothetical protein EON65_49670 [archaeon]
MAAQGEVGALVFDPAHTNVDVMLVHRREEKDIFLENISETEVSFTLFYRERFLPDAVDEDPVETETDLFELQTISSQTRHEDTNHFEHSLFCEQPTGKIAARSRLRLLFTYRPVKSGLFNFSIFAQVQTLDSQTGQLIRLENQEAVRFRNTLSGHGDPFMLPLSATLEARAAFPRLLFEDIRTDLDSQISDLEYLWQRFSFPRLNHDLSVPLTREELALYNSSSPDLSRLEVYPFEFSPSVLHSPLQTVSIQLKNHGYLETTFSLQLPNEKSLELENWCDEDEPSEELNK